MKVLAHTGIPKELLTDQGTVFTGKVMTETFHLLVSKHMMTLQSNGALERWHQDLK